MRYEFDSADIPAEGYDAQCSNCGNIFFVAPQLPETAAATPAPIASATAQVAIACPQCGAVYQFDSQDVPEAGYDAQCTQCETIFLVAPHTVAPFEPTATEAWDAPAAPASDEETSFASVNALLGQAEGTRRLGTHGGPRTASPPRAGRRG